MLFIEGNKIKEIRTMTLVEAERRIVAIEDDIKDLYEKTNATNVAQAKIDTQLANILVSLGKLESSIDDIKKRPSVWWDKLIAAIIGAVASGMVTYFFFK